MNKLRNLLLALLLIAILRANSFAEILRIGEMDLPQTYEPVTEVKPVERRISSLVYEGLIRKTYGEDEQGNLTYKYIPALVEDFWPIDEQGNKTNDIFVSNWQFKLKSKVSWVRPDGVKSLFTANDVKYTLDVLRNPQTAPKDELLCAYLKDRPAGSSNVLIPAIKVINPFLLQIGLHHPAYSPRRFFCFKVVKYQPDSAFWNRDDAASPYRFNPVGTGPYVMQDRKSHRKLTLARSGDYWGWKDNPKQNIQAVTFNRYDDRKGMLQACFFNYRREDALDIIPELLPDEIAAFEQDPQHYTADLNLYNFYFIGFNFGKNGSLSVLFNKLKPGRSESELANIALGIREAMLLGFDRESALRIYGKAPGEVLEGPYRAGCWSYTSQDKKKRRYSPAEARATLEAVGFNNGVWQKDKSISLRFKLCYREGDSYYERVASKFAASMQNLGIEVIPVGVPAAMWQERIYQQHDFDLVLDRYLYREDMDITPFFSPAGSLLGYQNDLLNEYIAKIKNSQLRKDEIQGLYQAMDRFLWDNLPAVFLWSLNECVGVRSNLVEATKNVNGTEITEPIMAFDGYDFFGNITRWRVKP